MGAGRGGREGQRGQGHQQGGGHVLGVGEGGGPGQTGSQDGSAAAPPTAPGSGAQGDSRDRTSQKGFPPRPSRPAGTPRQTQPRRDPQALQALAPAPGGRRFP